MAIDPQIEGSWKGLLYDDFQADSFQSLRTFLREEKGKFDVYPPGNMIFNAFNLCPVPKVKVVIIGQDPYHGPGQAHGLCFSVQEGIKPPPSLVNIFKEMKSDLGMEIPNSGDLTKWAEQGVLLLNATLTVRKSQAGSHQKKGWEEFTDAAISKLGRSREGLVFLLWGRFAQNKADLLDTSKHHILKAAHPSPFSAYNGFFGCKHFSKTNELLTSMNQNPIDWQL
jgi:uracil-DNA glycosylase